MAKTNFRFEKRQRELKKQQKKQEKEKRRAELKNAPPAQTPEPAPPAEESNRSQ